MKTADRYLTRALPAIALALSLAASTAAAQGRGQSDGARPQPIPKSGTVSIDAAVEQKVKNDFKIPDGFKATVFAGPPVAMYPTCVGESPDGAVFICVDPNLSLSTLKSVGRVMRLVDTDGDGHADRYTTFAELDSPRGVATDGKTVFVMHPPLLTAYRDTNGDGIADESTDIVTGLGFDLDFRGADHTTNNLQLGPDGWLYVAVGDYGFIRAVGTDGRQIQHRGGAVVRVRPDGTNLEIVAVGTRNIYDVSIDPFARVFARDNTNDGDGWDTRLHYLAPGANMGYPSLYQNFKTEHFPSLADYGAGAGVGSLWLQDPAWPAGFNNTLYTGDWTMQKIFRHSLTPKGAIFDITQSDFISVVRPADLALDGSSNLYVTSLAGGQFTYSGDTVGYVVQVRPTTGTLSREAPVSKATDAALLTALASGNAVHRLHAQQEILRRGANDAVVKSLRQTIAGAGTPDARVAAMFTLKQLVGARANDALVQAASAADARVRETALRALADRTDQLQGVPSALFVKALADADPQVKVQAIHGLVRLGARNAASALVPLTGSTDPALSHLAINALVSLGAVDAALKGLDGTPAVRNGALRAIAQMHEPEAVTALVDRLARTTDASTRAALVHTLARLHSREGYWRGDWWTTRPAHLGPYFDPAPWEESPRIRAALTSALVAANGAELTNLAADLALNQALPRGAASLLDAVTAVRDPLRVSLIEAMVGRTLLDGPTIAIAAQLDAKGPAMHGAVAQLIAGEATMNALTLPLARAAVLDPKLDARTRASLLSAIGQVPGPAALDVAAEVFSRLNPSPSPAAGTPADPVEAAWRRFVGDRRRNSELDYFINIARTADASQRTFAYAVLLQSVRAPRTPPQVREKVAPVLEAAWSDPVSSPSLVQAITVMRLETQYAEKLAAYNQRKAGGASPAASASTTQAGQPGPRAAVSSAPAGDWIQMFNGRDLSNWDIKFAKHELGDNYNNTFRVEDGLMKVRYDKWTAFNGEFGHIFYKQPFSYYLVAAEYRFVGNQVPGAGPGLAWALRNNGIMIHGQSAESMGLNQDFPISLEVQLLGGLGRGARSTANLCTPGTNVYFGDSLITRHCTNSKSQTYDGDQWVRVEALVLGDSIIKHIANGDTVMTYRRPEMGGGSANNTKPGVLVPGKVLTEGSISLQAETAEIDFRKVEILNLKGCMDPKASNYKPYYIKSDPSACR